MQATPKAPAQPPAPPEPSFHTGRDPLLPEGHIYATLTSSEPVNSVALMDAARFVILNAFDRRVERLFFAEVCDNVCNLHSEVYKAVGAITMRAAFEKENVPHPVLDEGLVENSKRIEELRRRLARQMTLMMQMPWSGDTIQ